jgi:hypothetical protein
MLSLDSSILALETSVNTTQVGINQGFSDSISGLTTGKQNILSETTKLNSSFLATSGSGVMSNTKMEYLSSISGDIQNQLALKADASAISNINNTSDLNKQISTATQSALDTKWGIPSNAVSLGFVDILSSLTGLLNNKWGTPSNASSLSNVDISSNLTGLLANKWGIPSNATNLGFVDIASSLTGLLSNKWNVPSNASNLSNIDITSSLTSLLGAKANLNGNTYIGTHDFTGSTILGLTASSTIADGSLTIAKTNGLQTALDAKASGVAEVVYRNLTGNFTFTLADANKYNVFQSSDSLARNITLPANPTDGLRYFITLVPTSGAWNASILDSGGALISTGAFSSGASKQGTAVNVFYSTALARWCRF